jgi:uncharacterized protein (DUF697 family)
MKKLITVATLTLTLASCQTFDNIVYKYGNGIKGAINGVGSAMACVSTGGLTCSVGAGVKGYINGKQEAREKLIAKADAKLVKDLAKQKAIKEKQLKDGCGRFNPFC